MSDSSRNLEEVNCLARELRERYAEVPIEERREVVPAAEFEDFFAPDREDYLGGAYAWVVRDPEDASDVS